MRKLTINNVLSYTEFEAEIPTGPVLITGENSSGKTSLARILAALVTHTTNPAGLSAALAKTYLRQGTVEGSARLSDGAHWIVPAKMELPQGAVPESGMHQTGIVDFVALRTSVEARAQVYQDLFLPDEPEELLRPVWKQSEQQLSNVLKIIERDGWKAAATVYEEQRRDAGRRWSTITGERYTKKRGPQWKPDDWSSDMEGLSEDDVLTAHTEAQDALRASGVRQAIDQDRIDRGIEARDVKVPEKENEIEQNKDAIAKCEAEVERCKAEASKLKAPAVKIKEELEVVQSKISVMSKPKAKAPEPDADCPHCGEPLRVVGGTVTAFVANEEDDGKVVEAERVFLERQKADLNKKFEEAKATFQPAADRYTTAKKVLEGAVAEHNQMLGELRTLRKTAEDADLEITESNDAERSELENARDRADARRKAWVRHRDALLAHENYVEYDTISHLLGPNGARAAYMKERMDRVRKALSNIVGKTGWKPITVTDTYEVVTGGIPAPLAAENERRKAQWAIQMALTMLDRSVHWLILDAADLLRGQSWDGLETVVNALAEKRPDLHIIVCATETEAPDGWHEVILGSLDDRE